MDDWINGVCDQVDVLAAQDSYYTELLQQRKKLEKKCMAILKTLPANQQKAFTDYEYTIMEMAYQKAQIAYQLGKKRRFQ